MSFKCSPVRGSVLMGMVMLFSCPAFAAPITASQALDKLQGSDPVAMVKAFRKENGGQDWQVAFARIKTGDPDWLKVAADLDKGVGAKGAELLMDAVARAIPENPSGVLHLLGEKNIFLNEPNICSLPLIPGDAAADKTFTRNAFEAVKAQPEGKRCSGIMQEAVFGPRTIPEMK